MGRIAEFSLGVAYYPDYLYENQLSRLADGRILPLSIRDRIKVDLERMKRCGINIIRIGEFAWAHLEPSPGKYHFELFSYTLEQAQLLSIRVILCTPTATPPKWLCDLYPEIMTVTREGYRLPFGSRRHYDPASPVFQRESQRITEAMSRELGHHPAVIGWQTDNELGNHTSAFLFSDAAQKEFQEWLRRLYHNDIGALNQNWFSNFWSHNYSDFTAITLPKKSWTDPNPSLELDFRRFNTDVYVEFQNQQIELIKKNSPGRFITHNITPMFFDLCLWKLTAALDVAGYDHYQMQAAPDPISSATQFNLMRSLKGNSPFMILEQQPTQVNWQSVNPRLSMDWLFLWGAQSALLGASAMLYFSWQKFPGGSEQYHDGIIPHDLRVPESQQEKVIAAKKDFFARVGKFLTPGTDLPLPAKDILVIYNMESKWAHDICAQSAIWDHEKEIDRVTDFARSRGLGVHMTPSIAEATDLQQYQLIILAGYAFELESSEIEKISNYMAHGGKVLSWARTAYKSKNNQMSPWPLALFGRDDFYFIEYGAHLQNEVDTWAPAGSRSSTAATPFSCHLWSEKIEIVNKDRWKVAAEFITGPYVNSPAVIVHRNPQGGCYVHSTTCPILDDATIDYFLELLQLRSYAKVAHHSKIHIYHLADQGRSSEGHLKAGNQGFLAAINFGYDREPIFVSKTNKTTKATIAMASITQDLELKWSEAPIASTSPIIEIPARSVAIIPICME